MEKTEFSAFFLTGSAGIEDNARSILQTSSNFLTFPPERFIQAAGGVRQERSWRCLP
jgi:hypothetical protein